MADVLVGSTGFVGSNLLKSHAFTAAVHSTNIQKAYGTRPELLVYAGVRAQKFIANSQPEKDQAHIREAFENIQRIGAARVVLISTIDVYPGPDGEDEFSPIDPSNLTPYGRNRLALEKLVSDAYEDALIVRLPALFGQGIKKNFIYDILHPAPSMLAPEKFAQLQALYPRIEFEYELSTSGFYKLRPLTPTMEKILAHRFELMGFTALSFTDSRARFQFFNLARLHQLIERALGAGVRLLNVATEPLEAAEIYHAATGREFVNHLTATPPRYNFLSAHASTLGGRDGYFARRADVLADLVGFIKAQSE